MMPKPTSPLWKHSSQNKSDIVVRQLPIHIPRDAVESLCKRWQIAELSFFGSILRDDFRSDSDVDVLVEFFPDASWGLLDVSRLAEELSHILKRSVDLVNKRAVQNSKNWIRKQAILNSAVLYYAA